MTGTMTRTLSKSEEAFTAVMTVGHDFASRIEEAQIAGDTVAEAMAMTFGMSEMQDAIAKHKEASDVIARAAGHKWGFKTDNDTEGKGSNYDRGVLIACFCEAALKKLKAVGNEFNVIQSGLYVTREGWEGKLDRLPGVTEVDIIPGAITEYDEKEYTTKIRTSRDGKQYGGEQKTKLVAYVSATASCKVWGQHVEVRAWKYPDGRDERLQLTGTADIVEAMIDQLKGKASARIAEQLFKKCVGLSRRGPQEQQATTPTKRIVIEALQSQIDGSAAPQVTVDRSGEISEADAFETTWYAELNGISGDAKKLATKIKAAWKDGNLDTLSKLAIEEVPSIVDTKQRENLRRYVDAAGQFVQTKPQQYER